MATRFFNPAPMFFYSNGQPLVNGLLHFWEPGTVTPKNTYADNALSVPNANPLRLSASGLMPNVFLDGSYRVNLTDMDGVQQPGWPRDSINSVIEMAFAAWDATITYGMGGENIVYASNGQYYVSIQDNNQGHDPTSSPLWWEPVFNYMADGQTLIPDGYVVVGDATEGLAGINMTGKGSLLVGDGTTAPAVLPVGTDDYVLSADSAEPLGVKWSPVSDLSPADYQEFLISGTWNKPAIGTMVYVEAIGAGGSGASHYPATSNDSASGGGGGLYVDGWFKASDLPSSVTVTIPAGGLGVTGETNGNDGGDATFGAFLTAPGGGGGLSSSNPARGGLAGKILGSINVGANSAAQSGDYSGGAGAGTAVSAGQANAGNAVKGGAGGGSSTSAGGGNVVGGTSVQGGNGGNGSSTANGGAGIQPGGGGGGTTASPFTSGAGGAGRIRVWTF